MIDNIQEEKFCRAYCDETNENATQAARIAGIEAASPDALRHKASALLKKERVRARIREIKLERLSALDSGADALKQALVKRLWNMIMIPYSDIAHISTKDDPDRDAVISAVADAQDGQRPIDFGNSMVVPACKMAHADESIRDATKSFRAKRDSKGNLLDFDVDGYDVISAMRLFCELTGLLDKKQSIETSGGLRIILDTPIQSENNDSSAPISDAALGSLSIVPPL